MLSRKHRLTKPQDFSRIYRKGIKISTPHLRFFFLPHHNADRFTHFGFVISKKQVNKNVSRNKVKRILRAEAAKKLSSIPMGLNVAIQGSSGIDKLPAKQIRAEFADLLTKLKRQYGDHFS